MKHYLNIHICSVRDGRAVISHESARSDADLYSLPIEPEVGLVFNDYASEWYQIVALIPSVGMDEDSTIRQPFFEAYCIPIEDHDEALRCSRKKGCLRWCAVAEQWLKSFSEDGSV